MSRFKVFFGNRTAAGAPATQTLTAPAPFTNDDTFYTHALTAGTVTLTAPAPFSNDDGFFTHVLTVGTVTLTAPAPFSNDDGFFTHVLTLGAAPTQTLTAPAPFTNDDGFYTHVLTLGAAGTQTVTVPAPFSNDDTFYTHVLTLGAAGTQTLTAPAPFSNDDGFFTHILTLGTPGAQTVTVPASFDNDDTFYAHDLTQYGAGAVTWNPADKHAGLVLSVGNLKATHGGLPSNVARDVRATVGRGSGLYYWEITPTKTHPGTMASYDAFGLGIANAAHLLSDWVGGGVNAIGVYPGTGPYLNGPTLQGSADPVVDGVPVGFAVNIDTRRFWYRPNAAANWNANPLADPVTGVGGHDISAIVGDLFPIISAYTTGDAALANFGATAFAGEIPVGFLSWDGSQLGVEAAPPAVIGGGGVGAGGRVWAGTGRRETPEEAREDREDIERRLREAYRRTTEKLQEAVQADEAVRELPEVKAAQRAAAAVAGGLPFGQTFPLLLAIDWQQIFAEAALFNMMFDQLRAAALAAEQFAAMRFRDELLAAVEQVELAQALLERTMFLQSEEEALILLMAA